MITAIRVEASMVNRDARFAYQCDGYDGWGAFFIQDDSGTKSMRGPYSYWEMPIGSSDAEVVEEVLTWTQAMALWNESAANTVRDMDPDHVFTGPQVLRITGLAKSSLSHAMSILGMKDPPKIAGRTNIFTRDDLIAIFERNVSTGRPVGGNKKLKEKIRAGLEENPDALPERWKRLVIDHFGLEGEPKSLRELSEYDGVTPERIRQIIAEALSRIIGYRKTTRVRQREQEAYARRRKNMSILELFEDDEQRGRKNTFVSAGIATPEAASD